MRIVWMSARFLVLLLVLGAAAACNNHSCVHRRIEWGRVKIVATALRDNIYVLRTEGTNLISGNIGVLVGPEGVFMVDSSHVELSGKVIEAIHRLGGKRLKFLVNTHAHGDHSCANAQMHRAGAMIITQDDVRPDFIKGNYWTPTKEPDGLPSITFSDSITIYLNGQRIRVYHPPHAHTKGDAIIYFMDANVLHMGDVFVNGDFPYLGSSDIDGYITAQERALTLINADTLIIPGHGPLARRPDLEASLQMLKTARSRIAALKAEGKSLSEVLAMSPLDDFNARWGGTNVKGRNVAEWIYEQL